MIKINKTVRHKALIAAIGLLVSVALPVNANNHRNLPLPVYQYPSTYNEYLQPVVTAIDYHSRMLYLINYENDKLIIVDPAGIDGWPGNVPLQHTVVLPEGNRIFVTSDNTQEDPAYIIALRVDHLDWEAGTVSLAVETVLAADNAGTPAELPFVESINRNQAVPNWLLAGSTQIHGPTLLPYSDYLYFTEFTSDRVRVINHRTNEFASVDPINIPGYTEQTHGVNFNKSGTIGLGTGYFFDNNVIDVYRPNRETGELQAVGQIMLGDEKRHAAFTHFVYWLDERFALTASMQFDKTSLTAATTQAIIPPSVWMIDTLEGRATQILRHVRHAQGQGVFRSASDLAVVNGKLYIAEEDTIDHEFGRDGYVSIFDLSDRYRPRFIKRLRPGHELPAGYAVAHTLSPTPDNRYLMLASWVSGFVVKIDTTTDTVVKVFGPDDGLVMPHGIFAAGATR
ncbi:YncE family protein [Nitrosomonas sp. ANs5]|uniref:YncE family protein n=1 Tax=Nitrosomonas sp. ANs5 TaxID=3423941 RepID=UPI003D34CB3A